MSSKGEQTRHEIVGRALALAEEVGLESVSLGVLAAGMNLSKSGLFAHFKSKEALQLDVLQEASERFAREVVAPALAQPRGEPRVRAMFENYLGWMDSRDRTKGCFFVALTHEYDDRPGPVRDLLVKYLGDWQQALAEAARIAVDERHFDGGVDATQFAFEVFGISMAFQQAMKLLSDRHAKKRARAAFEGLIVRSRGTSVRPRAKTRQRLKAGRGTTRTRED